MPMTWIEIWLIATVVLAAASAVAWIFEKDEQEPPETERLLVQKERCWHTGRYPDHGEACFEWRDVPRRRGGG